MKQIGKLAAFEDFSDATKAWFTRHGVEQVGEGQWVKKPSYFVRNNAVLNITAYKDESSVTFDIEMYGNSRDFNVNVLVTEIKESDFPFKALGIEARLCDAWNDLVY